MIQNTSSQFLQSQLQNIIAPVGSFYNGNPIKTERVETEVPGQTTVIPKLGHSGHPDGKSIPIVNKGVVNFSQA